MPDNPYAAPLAVAEVAPKGARLSHSAMAALLFIAIVGGVLLGSTTSAINGVVSPQFFQDVTLLWKNPKNIWLSAVVQGVAEGGFDGFLYGSIFLLLVRFPAVRRTSFASAMNYVLAAVAFSLLT